MKKIYTLFACAFAAMSVNAQTIFSVDVSSVSSDVSVDAGNDQEVSKVSGATVTGGEAILHNGHGSNSSKMITGSAMYWGNSGGSYLQIDVNEALAAGDKVTLTITKNKGGEVSTADKGTSVDNVTDGVYTLPSSFEGVKTIYIYRGAGKPYVSKITITREANKVKAPEFSMSDGKLVITSGTDGATIKYGTESGAENTTYTDPISVTSTTTYYAIASKDGMTTSDEASFKVVKAYGELSATFKPAATETGASDTEATVEDSGFKLTSDNTLVTTGPYTSTATNVTFNELYKVKGNLTITVPEGKTVTSVKVYGIANGSSAVGVTMSGFEYTTGTNTLPSRDEAKTIGCIEFALSGDAVASPIIACPSQARIYVEVFTGTASGLNKVNAAEKATKKSAKKLVNGKVVIETANGTFDANGARLK